jgi:uncharacterized RDD family membrane protein YckC/DNA-directed RNA polymerase subunit RPC12/RpoP
MNWHYVDQGQQAGPVSDAQLLKMLQDGAVTADTLVWSEGLPNWIPFRDAQLEASPPPAEAPPLMAQSTPAAGEVVCAECGKIFPAAETIRHGNAYVCAACKPVFLQKLAEGARVNTGELDYAGFGIRFGAKFLDGLILGVPFIVIFVFVVGVTVQPRYTPGQPPPTFQVLPLLMQFGFIFIKLGYEAFFLGKYGATPGKMICKLQVVTSEGARISYRRGAGRALAEILSGMICYIGYLMVLFDGQKRALHDHLCNTRVIRK